MAGFGHQLPQMDLPNLNDRPPPRRYQSTMGPHSQHTILRTLASLMASIGTVVHLMMPLMTSDAVLLIDSMEDPAFTGATICRALLFSHVVPAFLQATGLIQVRPREIVDQWDIKPRMRQRLILWIDDTP